MRGLFTEARPEQLPEGASPVSINTDYTVGSVGPRPGKQSVYAFLNTFSENLAQLGQSLPDNHPPEIAWSTPDNIAQNTPGTYASCTLNFSQGLQLPAWVQGFELTSSGSPWQMTPVSQVPAGDLMICLPLSQPVQTSAAPSLSVTR